MNIEKYFDRNIFLFQVINDLFKKIQLCDSCIRNN